MGIALWGLTACLASLAAADDDIIIADFDGSDYGDWVVSGQAFGAGPAGGALAGQFPVEGYLGRGLVNTYLRGDGPQGTLTSPEFTISRDYIAFLVGGGARTGLTCVNLLVDGAAVRTATGLNDERLTWCCWRVGDLRGRGARIELVDRASDGWGHINVDQIIQTDREMGRIMDTSGLYRETYRPQFHFTAKKGWLNDPNGLVYYEGEYHMFFQHNPTGIEHAGNMHWGHAVSGDLVHWEELPVAIYPDALGTIWSGSAVIDWNNTSGLQSGDDKVMVAFYTAGGRAQCMAYSNDRGRTFTMYDRNPVIDHIIGANRDPKVIWHEPTRRWIMALYMDGSTFALFSSTDLKSWTHLQDIEIPGSSECPDIFDLPVDGNPAERKWVLLAGDGRYLIGTFDGERFGAESGPLQADWGGNYYATQTYNDIPASDGRRIQIAWMRGGLYPGMPFNQQMNFPCELTLRTLPEGIRMCRLPVREIETLYKKAHRRTDTPLPPGANPLAGIAGELFDIGAEIEPGDAAEIGFKVRGTAIVYSAAERRISCMDRSAPLKPVGGRTKLRILVDRTSLEIFGNDGAVVISLCFLPPDDERGLELYAVGGTARIASLEVYELASAWK
jgi:fructan beta-fructosidase